MNRRLASVGLAVGVSALIALVAYLVISGVGRQTGSPDPEASVALATPVSSNETTGPGARSAVAVTPSVSASPVPGLWQVTAGAPTSDLQDMERAVSQALAYQPIQMGPGQSASFEGVMVSGDWAIAGGPIRNAATGAIAEADGVLVILRRSSTGWQAAYPGTADFTAWLDQVPDALLSPDSKAVLR